MGGGASDLKNLSWKGYTPNAIMPRTSLMKARLGRLGCFVLTMPPQKNLASSLI